VRFTENRNMQSFLDLLKNKVLDLTHIINKEIEFENVVGVYNELQNRPD